MLIIYVISSLMGISLVMTSSPLPLTLVNAFIRLTFFPLPLHIRHGSSATGYVNVTVLDTDYHSNDAYTLHGYCTNKQIATMSGSDPRINFLPEGPSWFIFNITVYGIRLGKTNIRFYISKNLTESFQRRDPDMAPDEQRTKDYDSYIDSADDGERKKDSVFIFWNVDEEYHADRKLGIRKVHENSRNEISTDSSPTTTMTGAIPSGFQDLAGGELIGQGVNYSNEWPGNQWWLLGSYELVIERPINSIESWLDYTVMALTAINLIAIGGQIDGDEALYLIKKPTVLSVALFSRFGVMPAIGLGLVELLQSSHVVFMAVLSMLCSPHEGASCLLALLADNDLTLTVTITCVINFAAVALLPLWTIVYESRIYHGPGQARIPFREMFLVFAYILAFVIIGFFLERRCPKLYAKYWTYLPTFTIATILFILAVETYKSSFIFQLVTAKMFLLSAILALAGYLFGAAVAFVARQPLSRILVLSLETGCRTTYITCLLLTGTFRCPECDTARTTPVLGSLLSLTPGLVAVLIYRIYSRYKGRKYLDTATTSATSKDFSDGDEITELKETSM